MAEIILTMDGVEGEVTTADYEKKIACKSMSFSAEQGMDSSKNHTRTISTITVGEITLERDFDKASIPLLDRLVSAKDCGTCKIHVLKAAGTEGIGQVEFLTITLEHVLVSNWEMSAGEENPTESITLNFTKVTWEYMFQNNDGTLAGVTPTNYNIELGKKE
ncbi:MAG: hypothetical protein VR70_14135 [Rhodospirillaceae bacterium BRH_c57]|nr:MAG: hypothetical protein VR70_14135 [Rhodospirillaceae bacterium BRH_c57]